METTTPYFKVPFVFSVLVNLIKISQKGNSKPSALMVCGEGVLSSHFFLPSPFVLALALCSFPSITLFFAIMSAREVRALQAVANSPPKRGRKRGQSNTEATNTKRTKTTTKSDDEGSGEGEGEARKTVTTKGKAGGKKGKKARYVAYFIVKYLHFNYFIQDDGCPASSQGQG